LFFGRTPASLKDAGGVLLLLAFVVGLGMAGAYLGTLVPLAAAGLRRR